MNLNILNTNWGWQKCDMVMGNVYLNFDGNQGNNFEFWNFKVNKRKYTEWDYEIMEF